MPEETATYHCNKYAAENACKCCDGIIRHEPWCIEINPNVRYAFEIVIHPKIMTEQDKLILHALTALWCPGQCSPKS